MPRRSIVTLLIASVAIFMVTLDNLVVTTALPSIRADLGATLEDLEWTVNAYTLAFAVFLLTGAALGDRFGRRRMFLGGIALFTFASALAALAPTTDALIAARALQGLGGAIVAPLTLTLLERGVPGREARARARHLVGHRRARRRHRAAGRRRDHRDHLVAVDLLGQRPRRAAAPAARPPRPGRELRPRGPARPAGRRAGYRGPRRHRLRHRAGQLARVGEHHDRRLLPRRRRAAGRVRAVGAAQPGADAAAAVLPLARVRRHLRRLAGDVVRDLRLDLPARAVLPDRGGYGPLEAGLRTLPWTGMPMLVAPIAGALSDRIGSRPLMAAGLGLQAVAIVWLAAITSVDVAYIELVPAFVLGGTGMALVFSRSPTRSSARSSRARRARRRAPTTRSASSAASSASRCWRRCSARPRLRVRPGIRRRPRPGAVGRRGGPGRRRGLRAARAGPRRRAGRGRRGGAGARLREVR